MTQRQGPQLIVLLGYACEIIQEPSQEEEKRKRNGTDEDELNDMRQNELNGM